MTADDEPLVFMSSDFPGGKEADDRFMKRWNPRRLHVRIDATIESDSDEFLSRVLADAIVAVMQRERFRDGCERFNEEVVEGRARLRFRYWNRYGSSRWDQLRNWWSRWRRWGIR